MNFADVKEWRIPEGEVTKVVDSQNRVIWEKESEPDYTEPFYVENGNYENYIIITKASISGSTSSADTAPTLTIEYSRDKNTWTTAGTTSTSMLQIYMSRNDKIYLRCDTDSWTSNNGTINRNSMFFDGNVSVGGNILSLLYGSNFNGNTSFRSSNSRFTCLFNLEGYSSGVVRITDASKLLLPATVLNSSCYSWMFEECTSLTSAPTLPATTLASGCYSRMFNRCTALTSAPELPATTLASSCYSYMFSNCTSLTDAPNLPATTLVQSCYRQMFRDCTSLNKIKCLATDISATLSTDSWLSGVSPTGTFTKAAGSSWPTGVSGIPSGWTVEEV